MLRAHSSLVALPTDIKAVVAMTLFEGGGDLSMWQCPTVQGKKWSKLSDKKPRSDTNSRVHQERPIFTPQEGVHVVTAVRAVVVNPEALGL